MKGRTEFQVSWLALAAAFILAAMLAPNAPAQSGRKPVPSPTPTPEAEQAPKAEEPKFVPDPNAEKYRLVFATRYEGSFSLRNDDELTLARRAAFDNFAEHLNRAGAQGYRVVTSLKGDPAVVALDKYQFEYVWTETAARDELLQAGLRGDVRAAGEEGLPPRRALAPLRLLRAAQPEPLRLQGLLPLREAEGRWGAARARLRPQRARRGAQRRGPDGGRQGEGGRKILPRAPALEDRDAARTRTARARARRSR